MGLKLASDMQVSAPFGADPATIPDLFFIRLLLGLNELYGRWY